MRLISLFAAGALMPFTLSTARALDVQVRDAKTAAAIPGAFVTVGSRVLQADAQGRAAVPAEADRIGIRAIGYRAVALGTADLHAAGGIIYLSPFAPHALYLTVYGIGSRSLREGALSAIRRGTANSLVIDVKGDRGIIPYPSTVPLARAVGARQITTIPNLAALIQQLHQEGIYAIARIVVFKDDPLATGRPDLAVHRSNGQIFRDREGLAWTDPFLREVREYSIAIAVEAARAGFDEVQFDYLRFPDVASGLRFAGLPDSSTRQAAIEKFLVEARHSLTPFNAFIGADVFGYICWNSNDTGIGQQLETLTPLVDYLCPMLYPSSFQFGIPGIPDPVSHPYQIVRQSLERARRRTNLPANRFRPWIQAFPDYAFHQGSYDSDDVAAQTRAAEDFGSHGWMLWNPRNRYEHAF